MKRVYVLLLIFLSLVGEAKPLTMDSRLVYPAAGLVGAGCGYLAYDLAGANGLSQQGRTIVTAITSLVSTTYIMNWLWGFTTVGKYTQAKQVADRLASDSLLGEFKTSQAVYRHVRNRYFGSNWPYVEAQRHLVNLMQDAAWAHELAIEVRSHVYGDMPLARECEKMLAFISQQMEVISERIETIVADADEYDRQYRRHQEHVKIEQQERSLELQSFALMQQQFNKWGEFYSEEKHHHDILNVLSKRKK